MLARQVFECPFGALDLWVGVVVISLAIELLLLSYLSSGGRFSLGWWAGRFYGLVSASSYNFV